MSDNVKLLHSVNAFAPTNETVAQNLRRLAGQIEAGEFSDVDTVVCVVEHSNGLLARSTYGKPTDNARVVGLLTIAAHRAMDGA